MGKENIAKFFDGVRISIVKHSPELLTGIGIAGMVTTTVLAVKATPKALRLIDDEECERDERLGAVDVIKTTWKCYIPAVVTCAASITCLIGASSVNLKRNAALATAYKLSEAALDEYKERVIETIGERKEQVIKDKMAEGRMEKDPVSKADIIVTDKGNTLCYDYTSSRYFYGDIDKIKKAENILNRRMMSDMYISLNEFYDEIGVDHMPDIGDDMGWNIDDGLIDIYFSAKLNEKDEPCIVIIHNNVPKYNYNKLY